MGEHCNLKYDACLSNPCLNDGTCFSKDDPSGENSYLCNCSERFYGSQCQDENLSIHINLNMTKTLSVRAAAVQFYDSHLFSFVLLIQHQQIYNGLPSSIKYYHEGTFPPTLGILKIYEDLSHPQYFLVYFLYLSKINITSTPQYCPHVSLLLSEGQFFHQ
jgi:hypothetical protein